jgi:gluconate kinase
MGSTMLVSQYVDLEPLEGDELGTTIDVAGASPLAACVTAKAWIQSNGDRD